MRRKISLYIGGLKADLDDESFILFNYAMEDLTNPTIIKNSFSQSVRLPRTVANNAIFGSFFRLDRMTASSGGNVGADFNPLQKVDFAIYNELDEVIESGYVKLTSVSKDGYDIQMYGGLGSFFYNLSTNADGSKKNLADLTWKGYDNSNFTKTSSVSFSPSSVLEGWNYIRSAVSGVGKWYNFLNYALCYDGFLDGFDYKHAVISEGSYLNFPNSISDEGTVWQMQGSTVITFDNNHHPTELANIVSILLRPVISVKEFFRAISDPSNNGGYEVHLDAGFFVSANDWYQRGWITLNNVAKKLIDGNTYNIKLADLMDGTGTPADYLIGFAKMFGLVFVVDRANKVIDIMTRDAFYSDGTTIDISGRIERGSEQITPYLTESKYYAMRNDVSGAFADSYKEKYDQTYGQQLIDTGYEFETDEKSLLDGIIFRGAAEYVDRGINYYTFLTSTNARLLSVCRTENVSVKMYHGTDSKDFPAPYSYDSAATDYPYDSTYPSCDIIPMAQFCDAEGEPTDGSNCLLILSGFPTIPTIGATGIRHDFYLVSGMGTGYNEGTPCFDLRRTGTALTFLPSFRRWRVQSGVVGQSFEFGVPKEISDPHITTMDDDGFVYPAQWRSYLTDRYDVDSKVVRCKVDLRGLGKGADLLQNIYWFGNCLWAINRIINQSLTTWDSTEVEFVKVKDTDNYSNGQNY